MTDTSSNKCKPEHNLWYLLATLYGEAGSTDNELHARNRTAWNRFMAAALSEDARALLIKEDRCSAEELEPFSPKELSELEKSFAERQRQATGGDSTAGAHLLLPDLKLHRIDLSNVTFDRPFYAKGFLIPGRVVFSGAIFGRADFSGTTFSDDAGFSRATFSDDAVFSGATFSGRADFSEVTFSGATFPSQVDFSRATFSGWAVFWNASFSLANFRGASFQKETLFVNAQMEGPTSFKDAEFSSTPPQFFGAKLHQGTVWRSVHSWPLPRKHKEAESFIDAYACLKLEMDRLKKHEDELDFFALEFQSRRVMHGDWQPVPELKFSGRIIPLPLEIPKRTITFRPQKLFGRSFALPPFTIKARTIRLFRPARGLPIALYGWLSDYGRSYVRPLCGLLITVAAGIRFFWWHFGLSGYFQAVGHSFANTFGVLGFRKDLIDPQVLTSLPGWLKIVTVSQTIAGIALLFLFGLAIRNRFRMK
jgi:uncharacterized protein YjbI with pentapeptide repeats